MALAFFLSEPFTYPGGAVAVNVKVHVYFPGSTALAPIYHDAVGSRKPNPTRTDISGQIAFYADAGVYDVVVNGERFTIEVEGGSAGVDPAANSMVLSVGTPGGVGTGRGRVYNDTGRELVVTAVRVTALNVGGSGLVVDVNVNGSSIYTQQANRPAIAPGAGTGTVKSTMFDEGASLVDGDYISVDVDQGSYDHLVVQVFVR